MKRLLWLPSICSVFLLLNSCSNKNSGDPLGTGPFDANGVYREDWADDPSKWSRPGKRPAGSVVAKNDQPPASANPLAPQTSAASAAITKAKTDSADAARKAKAEAAALESKKEAAHQAALERKAELAREAKAEAKADAARKAKSEAARKAENAKLAATKAKGKGKAETATTKAKGKTKAELASASKKKSKSDADDDDDDVKPKKGKSEAAKGKGKTSEKAKPKVALYTVKKGDTLEGIARKTGSSSAKIRKASSLSGSVIRPGQTLTIPKD